MAKTSDKKPENHTGRFPVVHVWLSIIYLVQGLFILLVAATQLFPVEISYIVRDPVASELADKPVLVQAVKQLFEVNLAYLVASIFFVGSAAHAVIWLLQRYGKDGAERAEVRVTVGVGGYALVSGLFFVTLGLLAGITSVGLLLLLFVGAILASLLWISVVVPQKSEAKTKTNRVPSWVSIVASAVAVIAVWKVIILQIWAAVVYGEGDLPGFVYVLAASALATCIIFGVSLYLRRCGSGRWRDPVFLGRFYSFTGLVAITLAGWQIVVGAL